MPVDMTDDEAAVLMSVTDAVLAGEEDSDHVDMLNDGIQELIDLFNIGKQHIEQGHGNIDGDDVKQAFDVLTKLAPSEQEIKRHKANNNGDQHPAKGIHALLEALKTQSRLENFDIPSFREWEGVYIDVTGENGVPDEFTGMNFDALRKHDDVVLITTPGEYWQIQPTKTVNGTKYRGQERREFGEYDEKIAYFVTEV